MQIPMYNIKIYDRNWVFKTTMSEKLIHCGYSFSASVNWGYSGLNFEYFGNMEIQHRDRVKIYKGTQVIYQGFVNWITKLSDRSGEKQVIATGWMLGLLAFKPYPNWEKSWNPSELIREVFDKIGQGFETNAIKEYPGTITIKVENLTYLWFLQELLKLTKDWTLFIDAENAVHFNPVGDKHQLTYGLDCFKIDIAEESSNYFNAITLNYDWGNVSIKDEVWIKTYGISELVVDESQIKDKTTAEFRIKALLQEKSIIKSCRVSVNNEYNFTKIKPWDRISVRNTNWIIENKIVKQVQYWPNTAVVTLDSYQTLEHFISKK